MKLPFLSLAISLLSSTTLAGPLTPPPGPITSTHKTLTEVEPRTIINSTNTPGDANSVFKITQPGSYYLTANITGQAAKHGIDIAASHVTIDLNGFALIGIAATLDGIATEGVQNNLTIRNGTITGWGSDGISLRAGGTGMNSILEKLVVSFNGSIGVAGGDNLYIRDCVINSNSVGILAPTNAVILDCLVQGNTNDGINTGNACTITNCSVRENAGGGILAGSGCTITNCTAYLNTGRGFLVSAYCTILNCTAAQNGSDGFLLGTASTITSSTSRGNDMEGINANPHCTISNCTAVLNDASGIRVNEGCTVLNNTCSDNGAAAAGILVTNSDNRIEGNHCNSNGTGIDINGTGNIILRNSCSGNTTNYNIVGSNRYGPIINITAAGAAAVSGNAAASTLSSTDANANYAY